MFSKEHSSYQIHVLRVIGTFLIILAHVSPPVWLFELRNFDVVLMVAISSISYVLFEKEQNIKRYYIKRAKRLIIPTWLFIFVSFFIFAVVAKITSTDTILPIKTAILGLFTFSGVGYLWVIRVYCYNAIINPYIKKHSASNKTIWFVLPIYCVYLVFYWVTKTYLPNLYPYIEITIIHFIGWGIVAFIAVWMYFASNKKLLITTVVITIVWITTAIILQTLRMQNFKYPPLTLYISYGLKVCGLVFALLRIPYIAKIRKTRIIIWLSKNSLTIYFSHIILLNIITQYGDLLYGVNEWAWYLRFIIISGLSVAISWVISIIKKQIKRDKDAVIKRDNTCL